MHARISSILMGLLAVSVLAGPQSACAADRSESTQPDILLSTSVQDTRTGDGKVAKPGKTVVVNYRGTLADSGEEFDNSYDRGEPFRFKLGAGQVIEGWDKGLDGMKVGGKRTLVIPPEEAYGASGVPGAIPPNATLKFDVELLDVQ